MNYRHAYHAGNFADVLKHATLALILGHLKSKDKPFCVVDTHAGSGHYDLHADQADRTGEWRNGIGRLWGQAGLPPELAAYIAAIRRLNRAGVGGLRWYPGSPRLVRILMRPDDRLIATELHPVEAQLLQREFAGDAQVIVKRMDGYQALKAFLPPAERRGLVLIDPPFEETNEFERLVRGFTEAHRRWAQGIFAMWYPIKDTAPVRAFHEAMIATGTRRILAVELMLRPAVYADRLNGTGLLLVNPPFTLADDLRRLVPYLAGLLGDDGHGMARVEQLVGE
jgi:23S rRNA (adenine2030-N6)-methyltransferase